MKYVFNNTCHYIHFSTNPCFPLLHYFNEMEVEVYLTLKTRIVRFLDSLLRIRMPVSHHFVLGTPLS